MTRSRSLVGLTASLFVLLLVATGCSSVSGGTQKPENPPTGDSLLAPGAGLRSVSATLDESILPEDVVAEARQFTVAERLQAQLNARSGSGGGDLSVAVRVIGMKLRSTGTAIWWGVMAGSDWITVDVDVTRNGQTVKQFQTGVSTFLGGVAFGGREVRVDRMVNELANRVVEGI